MTLTRFGFDERGSRGRIEDELRLGSTGFQSPSLGKVKPPMSLGMALVEKARKLESLF